MRKQLPTKEDLERMYIQEKMSTVEIGGKYDASFSTVIKWMDGYQIPRRTNLESHFRQEVQKPTKEELGRLYIEEKRTLEYISESYQVARGTIVKLMKKYGINRRDKKSVAILTHNKNRPTKDELSSLYLDKNLSEREISDLYHVSNSTIARWMDEYGIEARDKQAALESHFGNKIPSKDELELLHQEMSTCKIAEKYGVSVTTIRGWMDKLGVKRRKVVIKLTRGFRPTKDELNNLYSTEKLPTTEIASKYDTSPTTVLRWLRGYGIGIRTVSESRLPKDLMRPSSIELEKMCSHMSAGEIAEKYRVATGTVCKWLDESKIERKRNKKSVANGQWKDINFTLEQARLFLEQHPEYIELPKHMILVKIFSSLSSAILKYHGGFSSFRERLRRYMGQAQSSLLEQYAGGEK